MTGAQTITAEDLRALLDASASSFLGLVGGEVSVLEAGDGEGAIEVISHQDLRERLGDDPADDDLEREAQALSTATQELGG